jgi:hypothetical protein
MHAYVEQPAVVCHSTAQCNNLLSQFCTPASSSSSSKSYHGLRPLHNTMNLAHPLPLTSQQAKLLWLPDS